MGLLGPNGLPIRREEPVSADVLQIVANARKLQEQGNATQALQQMIFAFQQNIHSPFFLIRNGNWMCCGET